MDHTGGLQQSYAFPMLKNAEIMQCMSELGLEMTEDQLMQPNRHRDVVRRVFIMLVDLCLGMSEVELRAPSEAVKKQRQSLSYPSLHEDSVNDLKLLNASIKLMGICGVHDFGMKDFHSPTAKKFRRQLSGAINLAKFREDRLETYALLQQDRNDVSVALQQAAEENELLTNQLEESKEEDSERLQQMDEVENDCAEIEGEIAQQNKVQTSIRQQSTELKKKANDLKDKIATAALALQEAIAEERMLSSKIVVSPETIQVELQKASRLLEVEKGECKIAEQGAELASTKVSNVIQAQKDIEIVRKVLGEVKIEENKLTNIEYEVRSSKKSVEQKQRELDELVEIKETLEREINRIDDKIAHVRKQGKARMDAAADAVEGAKQDLLIVEREKREGMALIEQSEAELLAKQTDFEREQHKTNEEIEEMVGAFRGLEKAFLVQDGRERTAISG
uniref:Kinetochore protein Nuf2 n=1 Tax=Attheya septentrionalis TaxID=420275 RepID=A0A7S2XTJ4_9STRA|mmetsp:Transcript_7282/g.13062  ORF Transcript_7282/g.13062 Transcript_7282/m.13062 type:complete len:450 (+) Transcript_7282:147-1496(+)|eukprot:CAMPEP_0198280170 /NCGR_PEP_ID=MMETSP1449-20131203/304_1 /TAXON_ID=420275 /ORGANISM="Attheya septentrionalis, Strain CCMP2084" /LENGTH=449 /DNA_ID=CAMNT_0043975453 /DNA_START=116 /DNA_END=1465 /DNA_ORIENTATION=-